LIEKLPSTLVGIFNVYAVKKRREIITENAGSWQ
jgi:hypothetical protein